MKVHLYVEQYNNTKWTGENSEIYHLAEGYGIHVKDMVATKSKSGRIKRWTIIIETSKTLKDVLYVFNWRGIIYKRKRSFFKRIWDGVINKLDP
jgi:hypothetical protein